jgi:hypothetical protein
MKFAEVAENVKQLVEEPPPSDEFIFELLLAYGTPNATISRLKSGQANLAKERGEVLLKKKVYFKPLTAAGRGWSAKGRTAENEVNGNTPNTLKKSNHESHELHEKGMRELLAAIGMGKAAGLREAHHQIDLAVDRLYRSRPFTSDEERLEHLFKLYEEMTAKEKLI